VGFDTPIVKLELDSLQVIFVFSFEENEVTCLVRMLSRFRNLLCRVGGLDDLIVLRYILTNETVSIGSLIIHAASFLNS
jgi:hypothetical protein